MASETLTRRATKEWSALAGEPIKFEAIGGAYYAFGSELAVLRIANRMKVGQVGYSENMSTWYYSKETFPA